MSTTNIETDRKETLLRMDSKLDKLSDNVNSLKIDVAKIQEGLNGVNKRIDDMQVSLNKRIDSLEFFGRIIGVGIMLTLLSGVVKFLFPDLLS